MGITSNLTKQNEYLKAPPRSAHWLLAMAILVYLVLFGYNLLTRTYDFSDSDTMNFIDIARNIITGRGITQSTLWINQPHFAANDQIPTPQTSQPPLYPILIAPFCYFGLPCPEAALLISVISYGLVLLAAYRLSLELYDERVALLSIVFLLLYISFNRVYKTAFADPVGVVFVVVSLWLFIQTCRSAANQIWIPVVTGLTTGLAFATRYALLPLFLLGIVFIFIESKQKLRTLGLYIVGFTMPASFILVRNLIVIGAIMPSPNPSNVGFKSNVLAAFQAVFEQYLGTYIFEPIVQVHLIAFWLLALGILLIRQRRLHVTMQAVFIKKGAWLLTCWSWGYLVFLVYQRTYTHFDQINDRLVIPAVITMVLLLAALTVKSIEFKTKYLYLLTLLFVFLMIGRVVRSTIRTPVSNLDQHIADSERMRWVAQYTTDHDLIIGEDTVDIPFYLNRSGAVSFSPYPYTDYPEYDKIMAYSNKHCQEYEHIYLVLRNDIPPWAEGLGFEREEFFEHYYGSFITDLVFGRMQQYPGVILLDRLSDNYVFELQCQPQAKNDVSPISNEVTSFKGVRPD
jgi:4-amino-4-deoxy-L-arabinose transferase-like glycosyltransferase